MSDRPRNIAGFIPQRIVGHETTEVGIVKLLVPRFRVPWMQFIQKRLKSPYVKVTLDEVGSLAWQNINGENNVMDIGQVIDDKFGERVRPVEERLSLFFGMLMRNKFVVWTNADEEEPK